MTDVGFPIIDLSETPKKDWGIIHGEQFKKEIKELAEIRRDLMLQKNPSLKDSLEELAGSQLLVTKSFDDSLYTELVEISKSSGVSLVDLVILNNYTDFRDIQLPDEGCTTISSLDLQKEVGQTWDMHSSAKKYLCVLKFKDQIVFSLVGCLGMMGVNNKGIFIGVNNINTKNANAALLWPTLVRKLLLTDKLEDTRDILKISPVTSGHNYLISDGRVSEHWEVSPLYQEMVISSQTQPNSHYHFHTNHCLGDKNQSIEDNISSNSTTYDRFKIMEEFNLSTEPESLYNILTSHAGYPKSICSHFSSNATDPSLTCGGGVYNYEKREFTLWRGCKEHDSNYVEHCLKF